MSEQNGEMRIYVACLAAYNNGILYGRWIDADQNAGTIRDEINAMLAASPIEEDAEEWAIHDYEGFEGASVSEYSGIDEVAELAAFIAEHGALGGQVLANLGDLDSARKAIEDDYAGEYRSVADFAQELTQQQGDIPEHLAFYIDYEAMARDLAINDLFTVETGFEQIHIFWHR